MNINFSPLDRAALTLMGILMALTVVLLAIGDRSAPYVREFSWKDRPVGAEDTAFALRFSRSMDRPQVESRLMIKSDPANPQSQALPIQQVLPGKVSWSGKKMLYSLNTPVPYGNSYELKLRDVKAANNTGQSIGREITPFVQAFASREKMFGYIGTSGVDRGRLMIQRYPHSNDLATNSAPNSQVAKEKLVPIAVTPPEYSVKDFYFTPSGTGVFFAALSADENSGGIPSPKIYQSTIVNPVPKLVLDTKDYQNIRFELSADGKNIVVHRVGIKNPSDFGIWVIDAERGTTLQRISQGGKFKITPDSASIAVSEGQGVALKPLVSGTDSTEFMAKYGELLSFSPNGMAAALKKYNDDSSRDLFLVTNQGVEKKLLNVKGEVQSAQFTPSGRILYAIVSETPKNASEESGALGQPDLVAIDLKTFKVVPVLKLPAQQEISWQISPDGQTLLFDQLVTKQGTGLKRLTAPNGQEIAEGKIWTLTLPESLDRLKKANLKPQILPIDGFYPRWAP
jgi:hypothetical protein